MNKKVLTLMGATGSIIGAYVPTVFGDTELLDGWSILSGLVGGLLGIWLGVKIAKRF